MGPKKMEGSKRRSGKMNRSAGKAASAVEVAKDSNNSCDADPEGLVTDEDTCPVCLNQILIFSVGLCNHPVCSECSTRLRILCEQKECPICRQDMPLVVHTNKRVSFEAVKSSAFKMDKKNRICFETDNIEKAYRTLLEYKCQICSEKNDFQSSSEDNAIFPTFKRLDVHMRRKHELFFCNLCVDNLKVFCRERRVYNRSALALHRRKGDPDDSSHRGHPLCEFCDSRFIDKDELYRHLRRDHFFCHFCDTDGQQFYFANYNDLRDHFQGDHYLCTDCDEQNEQFTSAFRTDIDLKGHRLEKHSSQLSKADVRNNRTVDIALQFSRESFTNSRSRDYASDRSARRENNEDNIVTTSTNSSSVPDFSRDSFPILGAISSEVPVIKNHTQSKPSRVDGKWRSASVAPIEEEFPSLPGSLSTPVKHSSTVPNSNYIEKTNSRLKTKKREVDTEDFPVLQEAANRNLTDFRRMKSAPNSRRKSRALAWSRNKDTVAQARPMSSHAYIRSEQIDEPFSSDNIEFPYLCEMEAPTLTASQKNVHNKSTKAEAKSQKHTFSNKEFNKVGIENNIRSAADLIVTNDNFLNQSEHDDGEWLPVSAKKDIGKISKHKIINEQKQIPGLSFYGKKESLSSASNNLKRIGMPNGQDFPCLGGEKSVNSAGASSFLETTWKNTKRTFPDQKGEQFNPYLSQNPSDKLLIDVVEEFPTLGPSKSRISANFERNYSKLTTQNKSPWTLTENKIKIPSKPKSPVQHKSSKIVRNFNNPNNFSQRNKDLVSCISRIVGGKSAEFSQFKIVSNLYRNGEIDVHKFYEKCTEMIGNDMDKFLQFFPELITLLPDISKQKELLMEHHIRQPNLDLKLQNCATCDQILQRYDVSNHAMHHVLDAKEYPSL